MIPELTWLDDPEVFQAGRLPAHSDHRFYETEGDWKEGRETLYQSLNGEWSFAWSKCAGERPADFYQEKFDETGFGTIQVPGHIELSGYDRIHYINTMYPWEGHVYRRPAYWNGKPCPGQFSQAEYNPVGSYRRTFDLAPGLLGKRVCISFEGVEQAMYLWLNGQFVGYSEDSFTPAHFDLTPYIREKGNVIAVEVHKRSTAAYLEDQDFFRFSGIFRNVTLYGKPELHVEDMWAVPEVKEDLKGGSFSLTLKVSGSLEPGWRAAYRLSDPEGRVVCEDQAEGGLEGSLSFGPAKLPSVCLWDCDSPCLYQLVITLYGADGQVKEVVPYKTGFRRISLEDGIIQLNGRRLIINGVNRHEWNPHRGRAITPEDMEYDIKCLKDNHINSVRTCHYPDQLPWYSLCDEAGLMVMAETNLESHGSWQKMGAVEPSWNVPGSIPQWREAVLDRMRSNVETFKNHVSILFWSLGNESFAGENMRAMYRWTKERDPGRLVHYEGVFHNRDYEDISDMESQMYAPPGRIRDYFRQGGKKPFILCEYMHDMGNSLGGMKSYMELLDEFLQYQGGYIWDYIDQALYVTDPVTGREVLRYGGDFDDRPSDYEFSGNGIVFADRTPKPAMQEVRYYYGAYRFNA